MTTKSYRKMLAVLSLLAAFVVACDASPLPYPPDLRTELFRLTVTTLGDLNLIGDPGAVDPGGLTLRIRDASRPETPIDVTVATDGSFSTSIGGFLVDTFRVDDRRPAAPRVLAHVISSGVPGVVRTTAPTDADGDGFAVGAECDDTEARRFPGAAEVCDGIDNDCSGIVDDNPSCSGTPCTGDSDCDDLKLCNGTETCTAAECTAGTPPACATFCDPSLNACSTDPEPLPFCGNGARETGEECDDGNTAPGDGCESECTFTPGCSLEICNGMDDDCDGVADEDCATTCVVDLDCDDGDPATVDTCVSGVCQHDPGACAAGETMCGGVCIDILFDALNCGACGIACAAGQTCLRGICSA